MESAGPNASAQQAASKGDAFALAQVASSDELNRLHLAEQFLERHTQRNKRSGRFSKVSTALVGYVAFAGLLVNAYQSYTNAQKQTRQQQLDKERWEREFERAKESDKYRAFFDTSILATDPNTDKRLVGYALLQEFVDDKVYNYKATLMLEEALLSELSKDDEQGLSEAHRTAVVAILTSLSQTSDCRALERPARSIGKIAKRHAQTGDLEETSEVFGVYVRRIIGRAAAICPSMKEFKDIRKPIQETLVKVPEIGGLKSRVSTAQANAKIAEILERSCMTELTVSGASDCQEIFNRYSAMCTATAPKELVGEEAACERMKLAAQNAPALVERAQQARAVEQPAQPQPTQEE